MSKLETLLNEYAAACVDVWLLPDHKRFQTNLDTARAAVLEEVERLVAEGTVNAKALDG